MTCVELARSDTWRGANSVDVPEIDVDVPKIDAERGAIGVDRVTIDTRRDATCVDVSEIDFDQGAIGVVLGDIDANRASPRVDPRGNRDGTRAESTPPAERSVHGDLDDASLDQAKRSIWMTRHSR